MNNRQQFDFHPAMVDIHSKIYSKMPGMLDG